MQRQEKRKAIMISWKRKPRGPIRPDYLLYDGETFTGIAIRHCQHPTALRPYYILGLRDDEASSGFGAYRLLDATKRLAETIYAERAKN